MTTRARHTAAAKGPGRLRCAIYTRVSTEQGLEQAFNSLDNQREAAEAYVRSQAHEGWRLLPARYDDGGFSGGSLERPALQRLLDEVRAKRVDVIVVYKDDRLTRALSDFAKRVELFDAHGVSFVSVTQAFNTTTSMGRLTLNVLLSFAQFEREVTGERIRDKIAASKRKGLWMGGNVPLGYRVEARKLVVVDEEAERVRLIFQRYLELGSLGRLLAFLREEGIITKTLIRNGVVARGGIPFTRGPLAYLLRNRFYVGEIVFQGAVHSAEHQPIMTRELFEAVQVKLAAQRNGRATIRAASGALLIGLLFDDRGHRMAPSHARKGGRRYGYYVSRALTDGRPSEAGTIRRVSASAIEEQVLRAVQGLRPDGDGADMERVASIKRITLHPDRLVIALHDREGFSEEDRPIEVPWRRLAFRRAREIIAVPDPTLPIRPMRVETRETLLRAIANSRRWAAEITTGAVDSPEAIAIREGCSRRHINATLSLVSLAPDIVEAAIAGRLPHGVALRDLADAPLAWSEQRICIGMTVPKL